jgi:hypothetical protein
VSINPLEENAAFGWPLIILFAVVTLWLWREALVRALAIAAVALAALSIGPTLVVAHVDTGVPGPWSLLSELPLFDTMLMSRFALGCLPAIGALLALATQRVMDSPPVHPTDGAPSVPVRLLWVGALVAALLPIAPVGLPVASRGPVPTFVTSGVWQQYVEPGGAVVQVPLPGTRSGIDSEALHWQVRADLGFRLAAGYFVGPTSSSDPSGRYGARPRPTTLLLDDVRRSGVVRPLTPQQRQQAQDDLRYWNADVLVLAPGRNDVALRRTVDDLLGMPSRVVGGVWLWDVRALT